MRKVKVVPKRWMGARLGMSLHSLELLLSHLEEIGMERQRYVVYADLVCQGFARRYYSESTVAEIPHILRS